MATYASAATSWERVDAAWSLEIAQTYQGSPLAVLRLGPIVEFGGVSRLEPSSGPVLASTVDLSGRTFDAASLAWRVTAFAGWVLELTGQRYAGVRLHVAAVYRQGDKLTLAGYARDLAGAPLRNVQLHFIGETVQDHFFGAATNLDGIYAAFLDVGDTYTAFAFNPTTGITFALHEWQESPNTTTLVFRQVTKRGGLGEGLFLNGG